MPSNLEVDTALSATAQSVKDGNGNPSSLTVSTDNVGIGTTVPKAKLHVTADMVAGSDVNGQKFIFHTRTNGGGDFLQITGDDATGSWQWDKGISFVRATGNVGIGTTNPAQRLTLSSGNILLPISRAGLDGNVYFGGTTDTGQIGMRLFGGNINSGFIDVRARDLTDGLIFRVDTFFGGTERMRIDAAGNVGIGVTEPKERLEVNGNIAVTGDIRLLNADCAEDFDICETAQSEPGTVMVLGEDGKLEQSQKAYDKRVAGVVSGAGTYQPGIVLDKQESSNTRKPIALLGKVFCKVNAGHGGIEIGDLLTTSPTPGHAMKADDPLKAFGAVIGKALRPLAEGQGLIPILIALQ